MARMPATRGIATRLAQSPLAIAASTAAVAALVGLVYGKAGPVPAFALVFVPAAGYYTLARAGNGLALAGLIIMVVPYWYSVGAAQATIPRVAAAVGAVGLLAGYRRGVRLTLPDIAGLALALLARITSRRTPGI